MRHRTTVRWPSIGVSPIVTWQCGFHRPAGTSTRVKPDWATVPIVDVSSRLLSGSKVDARGRL